MKIRRLLAAGAVTACIASMPVTASAAAAPDTDKDGMPNSWEARYHLNAKKADDAGRDADGDGLTNLREFALKANPRDEDTDNDGQDDGDEVTTDTSVTRPDSDGDTVRDGDEDADGDGVANEDEDDAAEGCLADDDDADADHVDDEDENELRLVVGKRDSDRDRVPDGSEDFDGDHVVNQNEDDAEDDTCSSDADHDGVEDEDEGGIVRGVVLRYEAATGALAVTAPDATVVVYRVNADTKVELHRVRGGDLKGLSAIAVGEKVLEVEVEAGFVKEIELSL